MRSLFKIFPVVFVALLLAVPVALCADEDAVAGPLSRDYVLTTLSKDLAAHYNLEGDLQIELIRAWSPPDRVAVKWEIAIFDYPSAVSSTMFLRCRILADGARVAEVSLTLHASLWRDAWASRQPLTVGATFDAAMLEARRIDTLRDRDVLPAAVGDRSYIFTRAVGAGRLLTWHDIGRRPLVKKGEVVEVSAADGLLLITMKGVAMENGAQGETVTIRNPESRRIFAATVVEENRVQVRF